MVKILFFEFWREFYRDNFITKLFDKYDIKYEIVKKHEDNPDIIFFSVFGNYMFNDFKSDKFKNIKTIFFTGEPFKKPIPSADVNLTFSMLNDFNNIRLPIWLFNSHYNNNDGSLIIYQKEKFMLTPKNNAIFCSFVASKSMGIRESFVKELSKYKKVDCGGSLLNNTGGNVKNKIEFQTKSKFCVAYENSSSIGYTTEKILDAYMANCIPIYWGNPNVEEDFNKETMICAHDFNDFNDLIEYIKKVDNDNELYNSYMNKPIFSNKWIERFSAPNNTFFKDLIHTISSKK